MTMVFAGWNFYSLFYTACFTFCSGFVLISSEAGPKINSKLFAPGDQVAYRWTSEVFLNEIKTSRGKYVGFGLSGTVLVSSVWSNEDERVLQLHLEKPRVQVASKSGRVESSSLDSLENQPFVLVLKGGKIDRLFMGKRETVSMKNMKRGLASLFQTQTDQGGLEETDVAGHCNVTYTSSSVKATKSKHQCTFLDINTSRHLDEVLGFHIASTRSTHYTLDDSKNVISSISSKEQHQLHMRAKSDLGGLVGAEQTLIYKESQRCDTVRASSAAQAVQELLSAEGAVLEEETIVAIAEAAPKEPKGDFSKRVAAARDALKAELLGTVKSAEVFLQLLEAARTSNIEDISKALEAKKNAKILPQLYDILGHAQTLKSHTAVLKHLHLDNEKHADLMERYLWALSLSAHPNIDILEDMLKKYKTYTSIPRKVRDTLVLTLASMAKGLREEGDVAQFTLKMLQAVEETIDNGFDYAEDADRYVFLNALKNLQSPTTIPKLISVLENGTLKEEALAWRALKSFGRRYWTENLLKQAEKTLFQLDKAHDTSSRTLAADLLLASDPTDHVLEELLKFVAGQDKNFEVKQYVLQSVLMLADSCPKWQQRVKGIVKNNYASLAQKGLSTALRRNIFSGSSVNGSLVSVQEIKGGIVKRGAVDVILDKNGLSKELFTLGIFAGGLSTFVSSTEDEEQADEETATAGMELTVLGTQIRPFVFFEGQGELMGHVWSGTASELTPAFQALILSQDHKEYLRLGNGFVIDIDLKGAVSFDLSGKIELSIWNRNAQSLIKKSVGYVSKGSLTLSTPFAQSRLDFLGSLEPKLNLEIDADFSANVKLCMKLSQPDTEFRHQVTKLGQIPAANHRLKLALNRRQSIPGVTYALNRKNSEMCSALGS
uniref:Vitellogenin domain-containing protein n=1 Tax=Dendroctonus ponderosae TaxID=77166 RepID=A0AAR5PC52_DENPD